MTAQASPAPGAAFCSPDLGAGLRSKGPAQGLLQLLPQETLLLRVLPPSGGQPEAGGLLVTGVPGKASHQAAAPTAPTDRTAATASPGDSQLQVQAPLLGEGRRTHGAGVVQETEAGGAEEPCKHQEGRKRWLS